MKLKNILSTFQIFIIGFALFMLPIATATAGEIPRIGINYPATGIYSSLGPLHLQGLMMAIEDHGKLLGETPLTFIRDNATDASKGVAAARELITKERVHVVIGAINTPVNNAIASVCDEFKIPFLYPSGGSVFMSGLGKDVTHPQGVIKANPHPYMVYTWMNSVQRGYAAIDVAKLYGKRWYFVASDYEHGKEAVGFAQKALMDEFGKSFVNVGESWPKQGEVDYTTAITKAIAAKPDVVLVCTPGRFVQFQKQAAAMGLKDKAQIHWSYGEDPSAIAAGEAAYGITSTVDFIVENPEQPLANQFARRFYERYKYWPGWPASSTYAGVRLFLMAIEKAKSLESAKIMKALQGMENPKSITGNPYYVRGCDQKSIEPLYTVKWVQSKTYAPGYWEKIQKYDKPETAELSCDVKVNYDKLKY